MRFNRSRLHAAAIGGDLALLQKLIDEGSDLEAKDDFGNTPLLAAVEKNHVDITRALLKAGAQLDYEFQREDTKEARAEREKVVRWSMQLGSQDDDFLKDLYESEEEKKEANEEMIADEVNFAFEPNTKSVVDECGSLEMAKLLFEEFGADINSIGGDGYHPLKFFAERSNAEAVDWLLEHGAEVDLTRTGDTALHAAVSADSIGCATLLLDAGADPNAEDVDEENSLFVVRGEAMLRLLVERGAKLAANLVGQLPSTRADEPLASQLKAIEKEAGFDEEPIAKLRRKWAREEAGEDAQTDL